MQSPHRQAPRARAAFGGCRRRPYVPIPPSLGNSTGGAARGCLAPLSLFPACRRRGQSWGGGRRPGESHRPRQARTRARLVYLRLVWAGAFAAGLLIPTVCTDSNCVHCSINTTTSRTAAVHQPAERTRARPGPPGNISLPRPRRSTAGRGEGQRQGRLVTCDKPCVTGGGTGRSGAPLCFWRGPYRTTPLSGGQTRKALKYSCDPGALRRTP